jgi:alpha/beta superfamily hydrolase
MPVLLPAPFAVELVRFRAGPYRLEGELAYPEGEPPRAAVVLAGPQPLLGGDLHNNVVRGLGDGLAALGFLTLRFNYRGVGQSDGPPLDVGGNLAEFWQTSHIRDELSWSADLEGAVAHVRHVAGPDLPVMLAGYSFGCVLLPRVTVPGPLLARVLVAPTIGKHDYTPYAPLKTPTLVVASEDDFAAPLDGVRAWFSTLQAPARLVHKPLDNHFFRGHEPWLVQAVADFLADCQRADS